jgi:hypothetical protein
MLSKKNSGALVAESDFNITMGAQEENFRKQLTQFATRSCFKDGLYVWNPNSCVYHHCHGNEKLLGLYMQSHLILYVCHYY